MTATHSSGARAGSLRFWTTVLVFALLNTAAWIGYHQWSQSRLRLLRVEQFQPGGGAQVGARPVFTWRFNLDVAHNDPAAPPAGSITPAVLGEWSWRDSRTLTFTPQADLPQATRFTLRLDADRLRTAEGIRLDKNFVEAVQTSPLELRAVRQAAFDDRDRLVIEMEFSDRVIPAEVVSHLKVIDPDGRAIPFKSHGESAGKIVRVLTDAVPALTRRVDDAWVKVDLSPGLAGAGGPLGMPQPCSRKLAVSTTLQATGLEAYVPSEGDAELHVVLNGQADSEAVRPVLSVEPAISFTLNEHGRTGQLRLQGAFQSGQRYAVKIGPAPVGVDPKKLPRPGVLSVLVPDRSPNFWFEHREGYLGAAGNRTLLAKVVNTYELKAIVTRVYDDNLVAWRNASNERNWAGTASFGRPIITKQFELPKIKNKLQELRLSLDELLPPDAPRDGVYRVSLVSDTGNRSYYRHPNSRPTAATSEEEDSGNDDDTYGSAECMITLSDIGLSARQSRDGVIVWAVSLSTGRPMAGVRVRVFSNKNQPMGEAQTDGDGLAHIAAVRPPPGEHASVVIAEIPQPGNIADLHDAAPAAAHITPPRGLTWLDLRTGETNTAGFETAGRPYLRQGYEAFLYTDRGIYRPGEKVYLRGIVRGADQATPTPFPVRWQLRRPDLRDWKAETVKLDADGAALLEVNLPADVPTGRWSADLAIPGQNGKPERSFGSITFQVEEFIPNRMKMALNINGTTTDAKSTDRVSLASGPLVAHVQADYLFGRPVTELPATLIARAQPSTFSHEKWAGWIFGDSANAAQHLGGQKPVGGRSVLDPETLDPKGHAIWELDADAILSGDGDDGEQPTRNRAPRRSRGGNGPRVANHAAPADGGNAFTGPWRVTFSASVCEAGGRAVNASRSVEVDLVPYYVAIRPQSATAVPGAAMPFDLALVAPDGRVVAEDARLEVTLYRETWNTTLVYDSSHYRYDSTLRLDPVGPKQSIGVRGGRGMTTALAPAGGSFLLSIRDVRTGGLTTHRFYASQNTWEDNVSRENPEKLEVVIRPAPATFATSLRNQWGFLQSRPLTQLWHHGVAPLPTSGKETKFRPGETAQVIVRSPFAGRLLLTVETDHVVSSRVIEMQGSHVTVPVEIPAECRPNGYIAASVVRAIDPNAKWQTHRAYGVAPVSLDNNDRKLTVEISTPAEVRPSRSLGIDLRVTDSAGHPVANAAISVAAVDEGILQLTSFHTPEPFTFFSAKRALGVHWADLYSALMPEIARPGPSSAVGGDGDAAPGGSHQTAVSAKRVRPVALVTGILHTDAHGLARADFPVPEFSGQLRVMAVTYGGQATGSGEGRVLVRSPLMVQSSWPRFAAPGDKFAVPLVIFNNTAANGSAEISLQLLGDGDKPNPLEFATNKGSQLSLPPIEVKAGGQAMVSLDVIARDAIGVGRAILIAKLNSETYQESLEMPVRPASPFITTGGYVIAKPGAPTTLPATAQMFEGTGGLQVRVAPWPTLELPRGLEYLERYPYGCAEQTISTSFPLIALSDLGKQIAPGVFEENRVKEKLAIGITRLIGMQTANGGISMWPGERDAWPWVSVYGAHFVVEAAAAGHKVPEDFRDHLLAYVRGLLTQSSDGGDVLEQQAYACYVLALAGKPERAVMSRLSEIINHPPPAAPDHPGISGQTRFHLAAAWLAAGRRDLASGLIPQVLPQPRTARQLGGNVGSPVRERAIIVSALLAIDPDHPALPALVQQLADSGMNRGWCSTQDAAFAVLALGRYLRQAKGAEPFDSAELLRAGLALAHSDGAKPLVWDGKATDGNVELRVTGAAGAKAHVAWLQTGVPLQPPADADSGMKVRRRYLDAHGDPLKGSTIHSSDLVQIELSIEAMTPLENLVIDDLLPAGLEIENPRLDTSASAQDVERKPNNDPDRPQFFSSSRIDMRDDRLILCGHLVAAGSGKYTYLARAVSPGTFVVPPVRAECMYDISVNSLSGGGTTLTVLPAAKSAVAVVAPRGDRAEKPKKMQATAVIEAGR